MPAKKKTNERLARGRVHDGAQFTAAALDELTGVDFEELDRQYREDARQTEEATAKR